MQQAAIGKVGLWSLELRFGEKVQGSEAAAELDELGYGALWIPGGIEPGARVVTEGGVGLSDGAKVKVEKPGEDKKEDKKEEKEEKPAK